MDRREIALKASEAARQAAARRRHARYATEMREEGWICLEPGSHEKSTVEYEFGEDFGKAATPVRA